MITTAMAEAIIEGGRQSLGLVALYDDRCPLCRRLKAWLAARSTLVPIEFVAAGSPEARRRFPGLDHVRTTRVLTVVTSDGAFYEGERAWLVCGWALPGWRPLTERLGSGAGLRLVRLATRIVDGYRHARLDAGEGCDRCAVSAPVGPGR